MADKKTTVFREGVRPKTSAGAKPQGKTNVATAQGGTQPKTSPGPKPETGKKGK